MIPLITGHSFLESFPTTCLCIVEIIIKHISRLRSPLTFSLPGMGNNTACCLASSVTARTLLPSAPRAILGKVGGRHTSTCESAPPSNHTHPHLIIKISGKCFKSTEICQVVHLFSCIPSRVTCLLLLWQSYEVILLISVRMYELVDKYTPPHSPPQTLEYTCLSISFCSCATLWVRVPNPTS